VLNADTSSDGYRMSHQAADVAVPYRLPPADRRLGQRIDVLHAETGPVDTELFQAARWRHVSGIKLDGVFGIGLKDD
jgi:hypothetical protein